MNVLATIFSPFIALGVMLGTLVAPEPPVAPEVGASEAVPVVVAFFETTLAAGISSTQTSFTLVSATDKDGNTLASSTYAFVIDEGSANEEIVIADCTGTACTNALRGVSAVSGNTEVTALKKLHRRGATVKITDAPILMLVSRAMRGEDVTNFTPAGNGSLVDKEYVDGVALGGGAVPSTYTDDGILELATGAQAGASTATDQSGSPLALHTGISTSSFAGSGSYVVVTESDGYISSGFLPIYSFGNGADGDVTISTTTTLTRDMYYDDLVIDAPLYPNGYRIFAKSSITGSGSIVATGTNGTNAVATTSGTGGSAVTGYTRNSAGGNGGNGSYSTDCANGVAGGASYAGVAFQSATTNAGGQGGRYDGACGAYNQGAGGTVSATATSSPFGLYYYDTVRIMQIASASTTVLMSSAGGGGGGSGALECSSTCNGCVTCLAGGGGGGGSSGQVVFLASKLIGGTFTINAYGGNGGNGANGVSEGDTIGGGGGGGGGGNGGTVVFIYDTKTYSGTTNVNGGSAGTQGSGGATYPPAAGTAGATGSVINLSVRSLLR